MTVFQGSVKRIQYPSRRVRLGRALAGALSLFSVFALSTTSKAQSDYHPAIDPADFSSTINHPYFTLTPGTTYVYRSNGGHGLEVTKVTVTNQTHDVMGVSTRVVEDRVWLNGRLIEETYDWYAQDRKGNVWYFGEDSTAFKKDGKKNKAGSWEAGVNGAEPGIVMPAGAQPGAPYREEYLKGQAEDMGQIVNAKEKITVPVGTFDQCLKIREWSPLEPGHVEHKYYSAKLHNMVLETEEGGKKRVELVSGGSP